MQLSLLSNIFLLFIFVLPSITNCSLLLLLRYLLQLMFNRSSHHVSLSSCCFFLLHLPLLFLLNSQSCPIYVVLCTLFPSTYAYSIVTHSSHFPFTIFLPSTYFSLIQHYFTSPSAVFLSSTFSLLFVPLLSIYFNYFSTDSCAHILRITLTILLCLYLF